MFERIAVKILKKIITVKTLKKVIAIVLPEYHLHKDPVRKVKEEGINNEQERISNI